MKVSSAVYHSIFNVLVAIIMSLLMSLVLTIVNAGLIPGVLSIWIKSFGISVLVATPVTFITIPLLTKLLSCLQVE